MPGFLRGNYKVIVAGRDVTGALQPILQELSIERAAGEAADTCSLTLADRFGAVRMPQKRDTVQCFLNGQWAFDGFVSDVNSTGGKDGRRLKVSASSADHGGKVKEPKLASKDDAKFADVAKEWGQKAGLEVHVVGSITSIERKYWIMQKESFMSWGQRTARDIGATFKIIGNKAFFTPRNEGLSATGRPLTPISGVAGQNLLSWDISPILTRPRYSQVKMTYFDRDKGEHVDVDVDTGIKDVEASFRRLMTEVDEGQAKQKGEAKSKESDREKGGGNVEIIGNALAEPEAKFTIRGARPGIDGEFVIDSVSHSLSKGDGFKTSLSLKRPDGGAGTDTR